MLGVKLHPQYGLNVTMSICIICQEPTGEIAMLGNSCKGEAPMYSIVSPEPCEKCVKDYLTDGTLLIGKVSEDGELNEGILNEGILVVRDDAFRQLFNQEPPESKRIMVQDKILVTLREKYDIKDTPKPKNTKPRRPAKTT